MAAPPPMPDVEPALERFTRWIRAEALPLWAERGFHAGAGRFVEALDFQGQPIARPHRAMVQARQIYVFAHAALLGWHTDGGILAERAGEALLRNFCHDYDGSTSVAFAIDHSGSVVAPHRDAYTHAFVLFALAWLYRLRGAPHYLVTADRIQRFIEQALIDPVHGGLFDIARGVSHAKRQNPIMHLLEAYHALEDAAPGRGYLDRADFLVRLFKEKLLRNDVIVEEHTADWTYPGNGRWEPGHHYEWAWLLDRHTAITGEVTIELAGRLCKMARRFGHAPDGLIYEELCADMTVTGAYHRLWPHAEAIKAAASGHSGDETSAAVFAEAMADRLMQAFLAGPFPGGWVDRIDGMGRPLTDFVPASSLYHLMLAAAEADKISRPLS